MYIIYNRRQVGAAHFSISISLLIHFRSAARETSENENFRPEVWPIEENAVHVRPKQFWPWFLECVSARRVSVSWSWPNLSQALSHFHVHPNQWVGRQIYSGRTPALPSFWPNGSNFRLQNVLIQSPPVARCESDNNNNGAVLCSALFNWPSSQMW